MLSCCHAVCSICCHCKALSSYTAACAGAKISLLSCAGQGEGTQTTSCLEELVQHRLSMGLWGSIPTHKDMYTDVFLLIMATASFLKC